jgi:hypothetical protein
MPPDGRDDPVAYIPAVADQRARPNRLHGDVVQPVVQPRLDGRCMSVGADLETGLVLVENPPQLRLSLAGHEATILEVELCRADAHVQLTSRRTDWARLMMTR